jgi:hypothetical protein
MPAPHLAFPALDTQIAKSLHGLGIFDRDQEAGATNANPAGASLFLALPAFLALFHRLQTPRIATRAWGRPNVMAAQTDAFVKVAVHRQRGRREGTDQTKDEQCREGRQENTGHERLQL